MPTGKIKTIKDRGFGFITADDGRDIFFHASNVPDNQFEALHEGSRVSFTESKSERGPLAVDVRAID